MSITCCKRGIDTESFKKDITLIEIPFTKMETKIKAIKAIKNGLEDLGVNYRDDSNFDHTLDIVVNVLFNGRQSAFFSDDLTDESNIYHDGNQMDQVYSLIFLKSTGEFLKVNPKKGIQFIREIALLPNYWPHYFRRAALFLICKNWAKCKQVFFEMIKNKDERGVFVTNSFYPELYKLLESNSKNFTIHKLDVISRIINTPLQPLPYYERPDDWKLRWYSALREVSPFNKFYQRHSDELGHKADYFKNEGKLRVTSGTISPWLINDFILKPNKEIAEFFLTYNSKNLPGEPNVDGLARAFEDAVSKEPEKFIKEIDFFYQMPYIYAVHFTYGLKNATRQKLISSWDKLFSFFLKYISSQAFKIGDLSNDASFWNPNAGMVVGHISMLLTEVIRDRDFEEVIDELPVSYELICQLSNWIESYEIPKVGINDLATFSLNSTSGRILDVLVDFSLLKYRRDIGNQKSFIWPERLKEIFDKAVAAKNPDVYIIIGMNYHRFLHLDKEWTIQKIQTFNNLPDSEWILFMNGFVFTPLYIARIDYSILHSHYKRVVNNPELIREFSRPNLRHHLAVILFYNLDQDPYEPIVEKYMLFANPLQVKEFVYYMYNQSSYFKDIEESERNIAKLRIKSIWKVVSEKYTEDIDEEDKKLLASLHKLIIFNENIDKDVCDLCLRDIKHINSYGDQNSLIEILHETYLNGDRHEVCVNLIRILNGIEFKDYMYNAVDEQLANLIIFVYENNELEAANILCNKLVKKGYDFLTKVFDLYNA
jgi:hypothetical protein